MDATSDLRVFVRVMDRGNFSQAASDLGITPSAVSKLVSRLEDRLGVRLLERSTRRLALTPEGETFLARARQIVADIEEAEAEVARVRGAPRGKLRINAGTAFGLHQLTRALPEFLARYPEIDIELSITDRLVDLIDEQTDIAVRSGHIPEGPFVQRKLAELERVICAAPSYLEKRGTPQTAADLKAHDCIVVAGPGLNRWPFKTRAGIDVVEVRPRVTTDSAEAAMRMAIEGAGIIRLSDVIVGDPLKKGELVPLLTAIHHVEPFPLAAIYPTGRNRLPRVAVFLEFLRERFGHAPWRIANMAEARSST
ncbi:LysR family transcriptional regulator [Pseudolabrys sp. Root1462]|jgi:DNA-binding transcriptional LysR family regulator|uniref:LysR family transcriptional regulator n=1 Tax=Pseudolabrys sp. Root1462 TaxID=1736466 RepID=UPI000703B4EF|nr:LysR family transcriptional regulator [Pseudolabrys sp. Root1462]KQY99961.1 LysR family transcriptional regulator [Pseudolabrys sp. Root1462]